VRILTVQNAPKVHTAFVINRKDNTMGNDPATQPGQPDRQPDRPAPDTDTEAPDAE
jgi:hypothetical protein